MRMTELSETIGLMQSADYKERFKAEYCQTKIRQSKLYEMIKKYEVGKLNFEPKSSLEMLKKQCSAMGEYLYWLEVRAMVEGIDLSGGNE